MEPTLCSFRTRDGGTHVVDFSGGARLVADSTGVWYYPNRNLPAPGFSLTWTDAWQLYKGLEVLDSPQHPDTPESKL
jgi:hypothetical protein